MLRAIELWRGGIDLVSPFRTSFGTDTSRDLLYIRAVGDANSGWG
ncbi:MAG: o-succinylbenzoate synthase, partial [Actinobacteria bacterium]|nr:o-succinylbenzoate synthase [Actinomycetota bacterium]